MPATLDPFTGEEIFAAAPTRLFDTITDVETLADVMPDVVSKERIDEKTANITVRPGFSFIRTNLRVTLTIAESSPPDRAMIRMEAKGIGVTMRIESRLRITSDGDRSRLDWETHITEMTGLIRAVSPTLVRAAADQVIRDGFSRLRDRIECETSKHPSSHHH